MDCITIKIEFSFDEIIIGSSKYLVLINDESFLTTLITILNSEGSVFILILLICFETNVQEYDL